ncbi:hypothetical protein ACLOJK_031915 [Asimina triloba]
MEKGRLIIFVLLIQGGEEVSALEAFRSGPQVHALNMQMICQRDVKVKVLNVGGEVELAQRRSGGSGVVDQDMFALKWTPQRGFGGERLEILDEIYQGRELCPKEVEDYSGVVVYSSKGG